MRVALSASGYDKPAVAEILATCDVIYTTQYQHVDELRRLFRVDVRPIPFGTDAMYGFLRKQYLEVFPDAEFVTFSDLWKVRDHDQEQAARADESAVGMDDGGRSPASG